MASTRAMLCAGLAASLVLASPARAREPLADEDSSAGFRSGGVGEEFVIAFLRVLIEGLVYTIATHGSHLDDPLEEPGTDGERRHAAPLAFRLGAQGLLMRDAETGTASLYVGMEGRRFGVDAHLLRLMPPEGSGLEGWDRLTLVEAHLSHAVYAVPRARLRAEAGVSTVRSRYALLVGPSLGLSFEGCVEGPLDLEARVQVTPFPHQQVDGNLGLALHLGGFVLNGGWRALYLDDAGGHADGRARSDVFHGPYLGMGLGF